MRAYVGNRKIDKVSDLIAVDQGRVAEVTHLQIARPFGEPSLLVPVGKIRSLSPREVVLDIVDPNGYVRPVATDEVPLRDFLLDKKILDTDDREVDVVYDIRLARTGNRFYLVDVDISRYGLFRRLGLRLLGDYLYRGRGESAKRLIPWSYVQPLPPQLGAL